MATFLQVAEVWLANNGQMTLHAGAYGPHKDFGALSIRRRFGFGEGLPGCAWSSGKPQVWDDLGASHFVRWKEATHIGLTSALGLPLSAGPHPCNAALALLCGGEDSYGCIERWDVDEEARELSHASGYYGRAEAFARISPHTSFQIGHGLPGMTAARGLPTIIADTRSSDSFVRAQVARECGIQSALGIPVFRNGRVAHVVSLLSAEASPLAKAFEVWVPAQSDQLKLDSAFYSAEAKSFGEASQGLTLRVSNSLPGKALRTELPQVFASLSTPPFERHEAARVSGLQSGIAIPINDGERIRAVLLLLL